MTRVFIATPTTGVVNDHQVFVMRDLQALYADSVEFVYPESCVQRKWYDFARNGLVEEFLHSDCDVLWFLDSDVVPPMDVLDLITKHGDKWKLAGAPYPIFTAQGSTGQREVSFTVYRDNGLGLVPSDIPASGTDFVAGLATGCLFIRREVLADMQQPYFEFHFNPTTRQPTMGEDLDFCKKMKAKGLEFFVDYSMVAHHHKEVNLVEVNNYAMAYARRTLEQYHNTVRSQMAEAVRAAYQKGVKDGVASRGSAAPQAKESGSDGPAPRASSNLILPPGFGSLSHK